MQKRETFQSRLGFILVSAGCAIGLGNVWKFPYICGAYGGAAFILVYLLFLVILGLPILICEFSIGRASRKSNAKAFDVLEPKGTRWHHAKWISIIGCNLLMMFYTMVGGWMLYYCYLSISGKLTGLDANGVSATFSDMLSSFPTMTGWMIVAVVLSFAVCLMGLQNGVEKITKIMMILLIVLMVALAVNSLTLQNASEGVRFYLVPDFSKLDGKAVFAAMSQAFFTLGIGVGSMGIFGSYLEKERSLAGEAVSIILLDTSVALTAGFIVIPACFAYGVEPNSGPPLLFLTLPNIFNHMAGGRIWGSLFFLFMAFAAFSTIIAVFEAILSFYMDGLGWSRKKAVLFNIPLIVLLSLPAIAGFSFFSGFQPLGEGTSFMDLEDFVLSNNLLPIGSLVMIGFCTRRYGWGWNAFREEVNAGKGLKLHNGLRFYISVILPIIVSAIYLKGYYDIFSPYSVPVRVGSMAVAVCLLALTYAFIFQKPKKSNA